MAHDIHALLNQYTSLQNSQQNHDVTINKSNILTNQLMFQLCITGVIIIVNCLILIPIIANRRRFWQSYLYCLLSAIISSILFAMIGMPVSILFEHERKIILYPGLLCKIWQITSQLFWNISIFSIFLVNLDLIIAWVKPDIYLQKYYHCFVKIFLFVSWIGSTIENTVLVCLFSPKTDDSHGVFQLCLQVARLEHLHVSFIFGVLLILVTVALCYVLFGDCALPLPLMDDKLTCCPLPILLLDVFVILFRVVPEIFRWIMALSPGIFINYIDEKTAYAELNFITWTSFLFLPTFWLLDPTVRGTIKMAFSCRRRSRERQLSLQEQEDDQEEIIPS